MPITENEISSIVKERIDNFEFDTFVSDMIEYGQAVMQVEQCNERGIAITTKTGCFNPMHTTVFDRYAEAGIQVISHNEYLKQYTQNLDLPLSYNEDFKWDLNERLERLKSPKIKTEVDKQKIKQAIAKRARKLRQKEIYNESIKKYSRI